MTRIKQEHLARRKVAGWWARNAKAIREEDAYASHVTEKQKDDNLRASLVYAREIRQGLHDNCFTVAQRIHYELTGISVPFLPPTRQ